MPEMTRRKLIKTALAGSAVITLSGCSALPGRAGNNGPQQYAGAIGLPGGRFAVGAVSPEGNLLWQSPVDTRCHSGCNRPGTAEVLFFERRPGWSFYVFNSKIGERLHHIKAAAGEHFVGHGVFSPDGRYLYATASRFDAGEGLVAVYDSQHNYQRVNTLELHGTGPHQLTLHPDGQTLVVAVGGILTHPDYDRIKLNLSTMEPALVMMNRHSGKILHRFQPSHHQLSTRHVDVAPDGALYAAYQYQGPAHHLPPLVARYSKGRYEEIHFGESVQRELGNYIASIVAHPENNLVAVASPIGGTALIFDGRTGKVVEKAALADCAGVEALAGGDFLVSSGRGKLVRMGKGQPAREIASMAVHWDHHLV
ncbi:hypothetical protein GCM10011533_06130 [Streptosporangium jomthongense]|uniref:DUF1513 domain-containing protein n=1 Tax=Marinobacter aromaticivorans TaxID=1494078 RepID=A0ABW2IRX6_9GAMM|nr:DUF1513 domain-containing protein [Marinobacter aromaticivorans]GGE56420.1 hypothetical protein GCM10011533_06130 [Streptosporangium jomthongense]